MTVGYFIKCVGDFSPHTPLLGLLTLTDLYILATTIYTTHTHHTHPHNLSLLSCIVFYTIPLPTNNIRSHTAIKWVVAVTLLLYTLRRDIIVIAVHYTATGIPVG